MTFSKDFKHMQHSLSAYLLPIVMLVGSNLFMTAAWYGHLRHLSHRAWYLAALASCGN